MRPDATQTRGAVLVAGLLSGALGSAFTSACIVPDYCIVVQTYGNDWCVNVEGAQMWPLGQPELTEQITGENFSLLKGCHCLNDGEALILSQGAPVEQTGALEEEIRQAARLECAWAVPPGYDHNCFIDDDVLGPAFSAPYYNGESDECVGSCAYVNDPPFDSCGDAPNPWECNGEGLGETGSGDTTTDGTDTGGPDITPFDDIDRIGQ